MEDHRKTLQSVDGNTPADWIQDEITDMIGIKIEN